LFVFPYIYKETGRGHSSAFHHTIPYDGLPSPSTRRRALFLFLLFLFVESSKKKEKKEQRSRSSK
jgi:hypothetical protein